MRKNEIEIGMSKIQCWRKMGCGWGERGWLDKNEILIMLDEIELGKE